MNDFLLKAERLKPELYHKKITLKDRKILNKGESLVIDFGRHLTGYAALSFDFEGAHPDSPVTLNIFFAEHKNELDEDVSAYKGWVSAAWIQQETIRLDEFSCTHKFKTRYAFRYIKITVTNCPQNGRTVLKKAAADSVTSAPDNIEPTGSTQIERAIDKASLATLSECMQSVFEDGVKRDRRLWLGDLYLQAQANYKTFKHNDLVKRCLYLFAGTALQDGAVCQSVYAGKKVCGDNQSNFDYSLLFVPTLCDYMEATSDFETVRELLPTAKRQIEIATKRFNNSLMQDGEIGWCFIDWSFELNRQASAQAIYIFAVKALIKILQALGENIVEYEREISEKSARARKEFYDTERGIVTSGNDKQISYASNAWFVLAGILTEEEGKTALCNIEQYPNAIKPATPYMQHYYIQALIDCGEKDMARQKMTAFWGGMINAGADTFWEMYNPENPNASPYGGTAVLSYCHAWSCTPCYFLRKYFMDKAQ